MGKQLTKSNFVKISNICVSDFNIANPFSRSWSYGVLLYEILTVGKVNCKLFLILFTLKTEIGAKPKNAKFEDWSKSLQGISIPFWLRHVT